jgi:hypothetical protein
VAGNRIAVDAHPRTTLQAAFRSLVPEHRDALLATDEEIRRRIPDDLPQILQLEEWAHPDVSGEVLPSQSETFCQIADVLVTGDVSRYAPTEPPNTHWSNWPVGGTL